MRALCLDGPLYGLYEEIETAEALGYTVTPWTKGHSEIVLIHSATVNENFGTDGLPVDFDEEEYPTSESDY